MLNNIKKEILKKAPQALRVINKLEKIDFTKEVAFLQLDGKFTVKAAEKAAADAGYYPNDSNIILLTTGAKYNEDRLYIAKLTGFGTVKTDYKIPSIRKHDGGYYWIALDDYYIKKRFEEVRKQENITTYIICQKKADETPENPHKVDYTSRFLVKDIRKWCYSCGGASYIGEIELMRTDDDGRRTTYNGHGNIIYKGHTPEYITIDEIIDKSGYIVNSKRDELKRRAEGLRRDRAKAAYLQTDNAETIRDLDRLFTEAHAAIIEELKQATTAEALKAVYKKLDNWHGLTGIAGDLDRLKENDTARKYSSIERFTAAADEIREALKKLTTNEE